ncbi:MULTISPECIES: pyrroline-5-carboxylate reductase family protein [Comamonadaceae]
MIGGLTAQGVSPERITVVAPSDATRQRLRFQFRVAVRALPDTTWHATDVMVLAVKPQHLGEALLALRPWLSGQLVVSLVAGVRIPTLRQLLGTSRVVRAMPNVAARVGHGMTGLLASPELEPDDRSTATSLAMAVGRCMWVNSEAQLDAVTALSGMTSSSSTRVQRPPPAPAMRARASSRSFRRHSSNLAFGTRSFSESKALMSRSSRSMSWFPTIATRPAEPAGSAALMEVAVSAAFGHSPALRTCRPRATLFTPADVTRRYRFCGSTSRLAADGRFVPCSSSRFTSATDQASPLRSLA